MTEPSSSRPVPGPHPAGRAASTPADAREETGQDAPEGTVAGGYAGDPYDGLEERPVAEHVEVFEAEHARLQHELSTIDRL